MHKIDHLRQEYGETGMEPENLQDDPFLQFADWLQEAINAGILEPNAMTLATADNNGRPSARIVLLKGFGHDGFVFYTNYLSKKGAQLGENPYAALVFFWGQQERQVRIEGTVEKIARDKSEAYFSSRPLGSQIGAVASPQSQVVPSRKVLEHAMEKVGREIEKKGSVPCPEHWGGYCLKPHTIEFWQGRRSRLHDRIQYRLTEEGNWEKERLAP
jgi:pyridoxamine 5'-phosphate oxidase